MTEDVRRQASISEKLGELGKEEDDRFGHITILKHETDGRLYFAKERMSSDADDFTRDVYQAKTRLALSHPCLLTMADYTTDQVEEKDETLYTVKAYFEYPPGDLAFELEERAKRDERFSAEELSALLGDMAEAVAYLAARKMVHGDLRPKYFARVGGDRKFRLLDRLGAPAPAWQVQQANLQAGVDLYMSPLLYSNLARRNPRFRHDPYKSEVFSMGVILLEAGTLEGASSLYEQASQSVVPADADERARPRASPGRVRRQVRGR